MIFPVIPIGISFFLTIVLLLLLLRGSLAEKAIDLPNHRSLHDNPVPRIGGLSMLVAILVGWLISGSSQLWTIGPLALLLAAVSFSDDLYGLPILWRLVSHLVAAIGFVLLAFAPGAGLVLMVVVALGTVWMINLYNFMDGADGLAGGMALFGFGAYAMAAWFSADAELGVIAAIIAASAAGFLLFNFHPARIFLGDAGAIPLGFMAAALGLIGWQRNDWPFWYPLLAFSPFIVDATVTLLKRALRGEKIWQAHCSHYYQRLVQMGLGHRMTALLEYGLMLLVGGSGLWLMRQNPSMQWLGLLIWALFYLALAVCIDRSWRIHTQAGASGPGGK